MSTTVESGQAKQCRDCMQVLPLTSFHRNEGSFRTRCKACLNATDRAKRAALRTTPQIRTGGLPLAEFLRRRDLAAEGLKDCIGCKERLPLVAFANCPKATDRREPQCKNCRSHQRKEKGVWRRYLYGIEPEQYAAMRERQMGRCDVCVEPLRGGYSEHLDHDHTTGKIRGILCRRCNQFLGHIDDSIPMLERYIEYLREHAS